MLEKKLYGYDTNDKQILEILMEDSETNLEEIAKKLQLSTGMVSTKKNDLKKNSIITKYIAKVDPKKVGLFTKALILIDINRDFSVSKVAEELTKFREIMEIYFTASSNWCLIAKAILEDNEAYTDLSEEIAMLKNDDGKLMIKEHQGIILTRAYWESSVLPIPKLRVIDE